MCKANHLVVNNCLKGDNGQEVLQVDRCVLLPACSVLEELCKASPSAGCGCFRQRVRLTSIAAYLILNSGDLDWTEC